MTRSSLGDEKGLSLSWQSAIWVVNGFFLLTTLIVAYLPDSSAAARKGAIQYLAQFSLAEEKNLAAFWEGWCLLLVSILAFERYLQSNGTATYEGQSWLGLSVLAAGLSLDELGSIHERAPLLFSSWGLSGSMSSLIPLAVPVLLILVVTLHRMLRIANRSAFWLTLCAFLAFGSVAFQEYLEHKLQWPWWARGLRVGVEEGTELVGVFLLLSVVLASPAHSKRAKSILCLRPQLATLIGLRPAVTLLTLLGCVPLGILTVFYTEGAIHRGIPAAWLPFGLLTLAWMVSWSGAEIAKAYRGRFLFVGFMALFFSLDQIVLFQRVMDKNLIRGEVEVLMLPCMAAACMCIPTLRTRTNIILLAALLPLSLLLIPGSELLPRLVIPLQSLGILLGPSLRAGSNPACS